MEILVEGQLDYFEERSWKKRYFVMKYEISSALRYIEIYKDKNWQKQLPRHVVNLHPGYEVRCKEEPKKKHCFSIKTTDHVLLLASEDENVTTHWMTTLEEYNLVKSFCVQPQDTPTMVRIEAVFPCHLQLVHSEVRLVSAMDGKLLGLWPFKCIRRYKFVGNLFSIEAGRKAPTGEGVFEFISNECSEIYRVIDTIIRTKAGNTTVRRLASERLHNEVEQGHHPVRKVNSVPVHYDYADPKQTNLPRPPPPPVPLPSPPELPPPSDPTYDILSPGVEDTEFDGKFTKQDRTLTNGSEYNTLQFANARPVETRSPVPQRTPIMTGSPGSYDTLRYSTSPENTTNRDDTLKAQGNDGQYDTLQFEATTSSFSINDNQATKDRFDDNVNERQHSSGSFYDTLDHSSGSIGSVGSISSNTYDSLDTGNRPLSGGSDTYDSLGNTRQEVKPQPPTTLDLDGNTYDALQHESHKPTGKNSPEKISPGTPQKPTTPGQGIASQKPTKPPPRKKPPSIPKQPEAAVRKISAGVKPEKPNIPSTPPDAPIRKISAGGKPEKPIRGPRKNAPAKEAKDNQRPKTESISDVIQKRLAMPQPVDDGSYASVDHEYTSIDYRKVSKPESIDFSDIYAEPDQDDTRVTPIPKPVQAKQAKPARSNPKPIKNLFKKGPPKPKGESEGGSFADELKKKLEFKLKKTGGRKPATTSHAGQSGNDDDIYDEVDDVRGPYYSEPDAYSEPAV